MQLSSNQSYKKKNQQSIYYYSTNDLVIIGSNFCVLALLAALLNAILITVHIKSKLYKNNINLFFLTTYNINL